MAKETESNSLDEDLSRAFVNKRFQRISRKDLAASLNMDLKTFNQKFLQMFDFYLFTEKKAEKTSPDDFLWQFLPAGFSKINSETKDAGLGSFGEYEAYITVLLKRKIKQWNPNIFHIYGQPG